MEGHYHGCQMATTFNLSLYTVCDKQREVDHWLGSQQSSQCFVSGKFLANCHFTVHSGWHFQFLLLLSPDTVGDCEGTALLLRDSWSTHTLSDFTISASDSIIIFPNVSKSSTQIEM